MIQVRNVLRKCHPGSIVFFLRRLSWCSATCDLTWDALNDTRTKWQQQTGQRSGRLFLIRSLKEGLDTKEPKKTSDAVLMEAKVMRITYNAGEWSLSFQWASLFLCCGRMAKLFLSSVTVGRVCTVARVHQYGHGREMDPNFVVAASILSFEAQLAVGDGERTVHPYVPINLGL